MAPGESVPAKRSARPVNPQGSLEPLPNYHRQGTGSRVPCPAFQHVSFVVKDSPRTTSVRPRPLSPASESYVLERARRISSSFARFKKLFGIVPRRIGDFVHEQHLLLPLRGGESDMERYIAHKKMRWGGEFNLPSATIIYLVSNLTAPEAIITSRYLFLSIQPRIKWSCLRVSSLSTEQESLVHGTSTASRKTQIIFSPVSTM